MLLLNRFRCFTCPQPNRLNDIYWLDLLTLFYFTNGQQAALFTKNKGKFIKKSSVDFLFNYLGMVWPVTNHSCILQWGGFHNGYRQRYGIIPRGLCSAHGLSVSLSICHLNGQEHFSSPPSWGKTWQAGQDAAAVPEEDVDWEEANTRSVAQVLFNQLPLRPSICCCCQIATIAALLSALSARAHCCCQCQRGIRQQTWG